MNRYAAGFLIGVLSPFILVLTGLGVFVQPLTFLAGPNIIGTPITLAFALLALLFAAYANKRLGEYSWRRRLAIAELASGAFFGLCVGGVLPFIWVMLILMLNTV